MGILNHAKILGPVALFCSALMTAPAYAQVDLSGTWNPQYLEDQPERIPGPELVDYLGIPINAAARQWALSWDPDRLGLPEHQCQVHTAAYIYRGPLALRIWEERDPQTRILIAIRQYTSTYEQNRTIYMDGRPHPPEYARTPGWVFRPASGMATCSRFTPLTSSRGGTGATACRPATGSRWWSISSGTTLT